MVDLNAPSRALQNMALGLRQSAQEANRSRENMATISGQQRISEAQQALGVKQAKREMFLNKPDTVGNIISTMKVPDELKQSIAETHKGHLNKITTRKNFGTMLQQSLRDEVKDQINQRKLGQTDRQIAVQEERNRILAQQAKNKLESQQKDLRGSLGKAADDIYKIRSQFDKEYTIEDALNEAKAHTRDPQTASMLLKVLEYADMNITDEKNREEVMKDAKNALDDIVGRSSRNKNEQQNNELSRDKAVEYMRQANGDKEKAKQMARDDGYEF